MFVTTSRTPLLYQEAIDHYYSKQRKTAIIAKFILINGVVAFLNLRKNVVFYQHTRSPLCI